MDRDFYRRSLWNALPVDRFPATGDDNQTLCDPPGAVAPQLTAA
jgi:hypothetical protein